MKTPFLGLSIAPSAMDFIKICKISSKGSADFEEKEPKTQVIKLTD